jgi:O-acetyl-ADP-ribose deacetylase (regulator of RNase III)
MLCERTPLRIDLTYRELELGDAWRANFAETDNLRLVAGDITKTGCVAVVSPANSFGFMDGGLDAALSERFGVSLQDVVQSKIAARPLGELLIGESLIVETNDETTPWLIVAPTMRVPMSFNIATSVNAYLAMKAILRAAESHPEIDSVAVPGLCTGVGRMPFTTASAQMWHAYNEIFLGNQTRFPGFDEAQQHQLRLSPNSMIWDR